MQTFDTNHDGRLSLEEARAAAAKHFVVIDQNHDGKLERAELGATVTDADFAAADTDHDGTLGRDEYLTIVDHRFASTDLNGDGVLLEETTSPVGQRLMQLLE